MSLPATFTAVSRGACVTVPDLDLLEDICPTFRYHAPPFVQINPDLFPNNGTNTGTNTGINTGTNTVKAVTYTALLDILQKFRGIIEVYNQAVGSGNDQQCSSILVDAVCHVALVQCHAMDCTPSLDICRALIDQLSAVDVGLLRGCGPTLDRFSQQSEYFYAMELMSQSEIELSRYSLDILNQTMQNNFDCAPPPTPPPTPPTPTTTSNVTCNPNITHYQQSELQYEYDMTLLWSIFLPTMVLLVFVGGDVRRHHHQLHFTGVRVASALVGVAMSVLVYAGAVFFEQGILFDKQ